MGRLGGTVAGLGGGGDDGKDTVGETRLGVRGMPIFGRGGRDQERFRCGYCHGVVRVAAARVATVRGETRYVHRWHPVRPGEGRKIR